MSHILYDVIVIGAGPAGSYAAYKLSSLGCKVAVVEQKKMPGIGVCCTGIISPECFDSFGINDDAILARANSATFFAPSGKSLSLSTERVQAYVVDRASLDQLIAAKAQAQGVNYFFSSRVIDIRVEKDCTQVEVLSQKSRERLVARAVIVAAGFNPKLTSLLGLGRITNFAVGAQMEVETQGVERIEVYFSQEVAPGFFAWLVPISKNRALTGVISPSYASLYLKKLLASSFCQGKIIEGETRMRQKVIPLGTLSRTYRDRVLVVGDSAGQVKPTTGGGIYFGHLGAEMASEVLSQSLKVDDLSAARLSQYERRWKAKMGKEISIGCWARKLYGRLNDHQIEHIFRVIESYGIAESLLRSPDFSFDWHSKLIVAALKRGVTNRLREFVTPPMSKP